MGASLLVLLLLVEALSSNSYPVGEEGSMSYCRSILRQSVVRSRKGFLPPSPIVWKTNQVIVSGPNR